MINHHFFDFSKADPVFLFMTFVLSILITFLMVTYSWQAPGAKYTAKEVVEKFGKGKYLSGKTAIVTGGNSGIGLETCKAFTSAGCKVILCSRSIKAGDDAVVKEISKLGEGGYLGDSSLVEVKQLDLSSLKSVKSLADDVLKTNKSIDFVVCNAGIMALPNKELTDAGFEKQIGVNHFGHAYFVSLLQDKLIKQQTPVRVVFLASVAHKFGGLKLNDLHFSGRKYSPWLAYGQSKLANVLYAKALSEELKGTQCTAISLHPGIIQTNLFAPSSSQLSGNLFSYLFTKITSVFLVNKSIPQGASTTMHACLSPELASDSNRGVYLDNCKITEPKLPYKTAHREFWDETQLQLKEAIAKLGLQ